MMNDMEIMRVFGLPNTTTRDWKKRGDWRTNIYIFLKHQNKNVVLNSTATHELTNIEINKLFGVPVSTLQDWRRADNDWRQKVFLFLRSQDKDFVKSFFDMVNILEQTSGE